MPSYLKHYEKIKLKRVFLLGLFLETILKTLIQIETNTHWVNESNADAVEGHLSEIYYICSLQQARVRRVSCCPVFEDRGCVFCCCATTVAPLLSSRYLQ